MNGEPEAMILRTDSLRPQEAAGGLWENRAAAYQMYDAPEVPKCTVAVLAYNRLQKTKYCVACILQHTKDVDYELLLIDNGSNDGTLDYFKSVEYEKKRVVCITRNIGSGYAWRTARDCFKGKYLVLISNDVYVTKNWLSNLLQCYESDPRIGFVSPVSSNVSNFQQVDLHYGTYEEMQQAAAAYNQSDPSKWDQRMRLISLIGIYSRPVLDIVGMNDAAYLHDFIEDDLAVRLRRCGYKLMLCCDTWVCHDHDFRNLEDKDPAEFQASLNDGRAIYQEKYHGLDAWDDILNFEFPLLARVHTHAFPAGKLRSLVIDGRCGTPVLEIRNILRRRGLTDLESYAFTTHAKYYQDLQTVSHNVQCGPIDRIQACYDGLPLDLAVLCDPVNFYPVPVTALWTVYRNLKPGGLLLFKLCGINNWDAFLRISGKTLESIDSFKAHAAAADGAGAAARDTFLNILRTIKPDVGSGDCENSIFYIIKE